MTTLSRVYTNYSSEHLGLYEEVREVITCIQNKTQGDRRRCLREHLDTNQRTDYHGG